MPDLPEMVTYCPECGSEVETLTQPAMAKVDTEVSCDNCGERLPLGELRVNLADVIPPTP